MENAMYDIFFRANGFRGRGWAQSEGHEIFGGDRVYKFAGRFNEDSGQLRGTMAISIDSGVLANSAINKQFNLRMTGPRSSIGFSLIGAGPLGLIVEIDAVRTIAHPVPRLVAATSTDAQVLERCIEAFIAISHEYLDATYAPQPPEHVAITLMVFKTALQELKPLLPQSLASSAVAFFEESRSLPLGWDSGVEQEAHAARAEAWAALGDELASELSALLRNRVTAGNSEKF